MDIVFICIYAFTILFASVVHGSIGFGFGMTATSVLALCTDLKTVITMLLIPTMATNVISVLSEGKFFEALKKFWFVIVLLILGSIAGTLLLVHFDSKIFKLLLALIILFYLYQSYKNVRLSFIKNHPTIATYILGLVGGIVAGITNNVAPLLIMYTIELEYSKKDTIQLSNLSFLVTKIGQFGVFWCYGEFDTTSFKMSALGLAIVLFGMFFGIKIKKKIDRKFYVKILKGLLFFISVMLIISTLK